MFYIRRQLIFVFCFSTMMVSAGCAKKPKKAEACAEPTAQGLGPNGKGYAFLPDPVSSTGNLNLSPSSLSLDSVRASVGLDNLKGTGVLDGKHVAVLEGNSCGGSFNAFSKKNEFYFSHSDGRFQEVMAYYTADEYLSFLEREGLKQQSQSIKVIAHCGFQDNAFYVWTSTGGIVCLGDSISAPGSSYADDGLVAIHEVQHATTNLAYSKDPFTQLNGFFATEGGALNEGISDFVGLLDTEEEVQKNNLDPKVFGRWSLGLFDPGWRATRGAHRCPEYDSDFPRCSAYPAFSAKENHVSFIYPDGLGWSYPKNSRGPRFVREAFDVNRMPEEIHSNGVLVQGTLWDVYQSLLKTQKWEPSELRELLIRMVIKTLQSLPQPTDQNLSPVNFVQFFSTMYSLAGTSIPEFAGDPIAMGAIQEALQERGFLLSTNQKLQSGWLGLGDGENQTGVKILDNPAMLKDWLKDLLRTDRDLKLVKQTNTTGLNGQLDPGETAVLWLDLKNLSPITAGEVYLKMEIRQSDLDAIEFFNFDYPGYVLNVGAISNAETHISYFKINGSSILNQFQTADPLFSSWVPQTGNTYFKTHPFFDRSYWSGVWLKVKDSASSGRIVQLKVTATPSNGSTEILDVPLRIR